MQQHPLRLPTLGEQARKLAAEQKRTMALSRLGVAVTPANQVVLDNLIKSEATGGCFLAAAFGGLLIREMRLEKAGQFHQGHRHAFDHVTMLFKGRVLCERLGKPSKIYEAPAAIEIPAAEWHKFTALQDECLYYCVFARNGAKNAVEDQLVARELPVEPEELTHHMVATGASTCGSCSKGLK